ncbi:winged helix-turn-helix transcriptional regulator [bacterium]|nr:winged helix-turn-helix transcriptional regulator [bacterium]
MTAREKQILELIRNNPLVSQKELAEQLNIARSSVAVHITNLIKKGKIKGKGYVLDEEDYVVVIGGANMDITGFSDNLLVPNDSNPGRIRMSSGGVGRNIAANLAKLGIQTKLISAVGDDLFGRRIIEDSSLAGIDTAYIKTVSAHPSSIYLSIINATGEMDVAVSDMKITDSLDTEWLKKHHQLISGAAAVVMETNLPQSSIRYLANTHGAKLFLDTVSTTKTKKVKDIIGSFHTIKPNRIEAEYLTDFKIQNQTDVEKAVRFFLDKGTTNVFISLGKEGVAYGTADKTGFFKMKTERMVNTTGAGDAFMAVLVYGYLNDIDIHEAVKLASTASYLTLTSEDTSNPEISLQQILKTKEKLNL